MRRQAAVAVVAAGLIVTGGGIAAASSSHLPAADRVRPADGRVTGRLERVGGPLGPGGQQPPVVPLAGTIVFSRTGHPAVRAHAGKSGRFSVRLAPGDYTVRGRAQGLPACRLAGRLTVRADRTRHIVVACVVP
jgi:hypothetical protein